MKLNVWALGLASSFIWGFGIFLITWWIIYFEGQTGEVTFLGMMYRGYNLSANGSLVGLAWGLIDGFVGGVIFAWLYNFLSSKFSSN